MSDEQTQPVQFEKSMAELENIVKQLESGELSLEQSLECFEQGVKLTRQCQEALNKAEQKVAILMKDSGELADFDAEE